MPATLQPEARRVTAESRPAPFPGGVPPDPRDGCASPRPSAGSRVMTSPPGRASRSGVSHDPKVGQYADLNQLRPMSVPNVETQCRHGTAKRPMREVHDWHGGRHRHVRDADVDAPKHARDHAHNPRKLEILSDPAARVAESLRYRKSVQEYQAKHAPDQLKPQEAKSEHTPPETLDKPTSAIAKRAIPEAREARRQPRPERPRLPSNEATQFAVSIGALASNVADVLGLIPSRADGLAVGTLAAVVAGVAWGNKRWKDRHGDRSKD